MVNPNPGFLSKRVKRRDQSGITSDRYEFLGLDQAEPDLGDPIVGVSSVGVNPYTGNIPNLYVLASDNTGSGNRYWIKQTDVITGGVITPGAITIRDEGLIIGGVNQVNDINFIGAGVTITARPGAGSSAIDIQIAVADVTGAGNVGNIQFKGSNNLAQGSDQFSYDAVNQRVGIGSTNPRQKLDVRGNVVVSGIVSASELTASSFSVNNVSIDSSGLIFNVKSAGVGIGTTQPRATLDVLGTANVTGVLTATRLSTSQLDATNINVTGIGTLQTLNVTSQSTLSNVNVSGTTTSTRLVSSSLNVSGVGTITTLNSTTGSVGIITGNNLSYTGISTITNVRSATINNTGVTTTASLNVGVGGTIITTTGIGSVGLGTTVPRSRLDVVGDIRFNGLIIASNGSGVSGQVLLSNGANPVTWGNPTEISAGSATSVATLAGTSNTTYYITFVPQTSGIQTLNLDTDSLTYNPSTNTLTVDAINTKNLQVDGLSRNTTGIVTTSSKNEVVIDNLDTNTFRSAKYNIQVNTIGQLTLGTSASVSGLSSGRNYFPGTYTNVALTNIVGTGTEGRATITVSPEATLPITQSLNGTFTTSGSLVGIGTSQSIIFNQTLAPGPLENSRVTNITLTNNGSGYTSVPTFTFTSPIIAGNPIEGVGVGSTARGIVSSMRVSNVVFNNVGFLTTLVPSVTIKSPGSGTTATANVGYALSTITVTDNGIGYLSIPIVQFSSNNATAGVSSVFVNNIRVSNPGYGYTVGDLNESVVFSSGSAAATNSSFSLPNSHLGFNIINPGAGYTTPPTLTVSSPQIGINTGTVTSTLGISTFTVTSPGSGYTVSPSITNNPSVTNFSGRVGLGVSTLAIQISGGSNYTGAPTITFNPVGGIGTGAAGEFTSINPDPPFNLLDFVLTNPGFGYTVPPTVTVSGGGGTGAGVTIRTMIVTNVTVTNVGHGATEVVSSSLSTNPIEFLDNPFSRTGVVGVATTSRVDNIIFSSQGTLSTASTTIISGISTFNTVIREKTGNLDAINDTSISGIDTSNVSVGFAVTGTFVQGGTTVASISSGTIGLSTNLTNPSVGFGLTFYIADTLSQRVIVGQGVSGPSINLTESGTTVTSIGNSSVTLSRTTLNIGIQTSTFFFGTLTTIPGIFQTNVITGITTSGISTGQRVTSTITPANTNVLSVGVGSIAIDKTTTNVGVATTAFTFFTVTTAAGAGASISPLMGIGRVTTVGFGTGYTALPGIAVTAVDGVTGGGGIVTTTSFGIDTNCFSITNPGIYTAIPSVLINPPTSGETAVADVGVGLSVISVTFGGSYVGTKPTISFSGGSPLVSAAATVTNIVLNGVSVVTAGSGYTSGDFPITATFSNVSLGATVGLGVENITLTSAGVGYTVTPTITFTDPTLPAGVRATANAVLANFGPEFSLSPGPGYGSTFVYYIEPLSSNTFRIFRDINRTNQVTLGFSTVGSPTAFVGGRISNVSVTYAGSGYSAGNILGASAVSLGNTFSANVGTGFSFTATNIVQNYQISEILMLQSVGSASTSVDIIEYAGIANLDDLISFSADLSGTNARLKTTPKYRDNTIKINRTSITR